MTYRGRTSLACRMLLSAILLSGCESKMDDTGRPSETDQDAAVEARVAIDFQIPDLGEGYSIGRLVDGAIGKDGGLFLLDSYQSTVLHFSATGQFVTSIGRRGEGPGELSVGVLSIDVLSDSSIVIVDHSLSRTVTFDPRGSPIATRPIPVVPGFPRKFGVLSDGRVLAESVGSGTVSLLSLSAEGWEPLRSDEATTPRLENGRMIEPVLPVEIFFAGSRGTLLSYTTVDENLTVHEGSVDADALALPAPQPVDRVVEARLHDLWRRSKVERGATPSAFNLMEPAVPSMVPAIAGLHYDDSHSTLYVLRMPAADSWPVGEWLVEGLGHLAVGELLAFPPSGGVQSYVLPRPARILDVRGGRILTTRVDAQGLPVVEVLELG